MKHFTEEQLKELETLYGLVRAPNVLTISDGIVKPENKVWWKCEDGPILVTAKHDWDNIKEYPELYSHAKPAIKITYVD